jgi:adenylate cyclase
VDEKGQMLVNFRWRERRITEYPIWRVLEDKSSAAMSVFTDRTVIVGSRLEGDSDVGALPERPASPLLWVHALAVDTILSNSFVVPAGNLLAAILILAGGFAAAFAGTLFRPWLAALLVALGLASYAVVSLLAFAGHTRFALPVAGPVTATLAGYLGATFARHWREEHERRTLANALSRYLSPAVTRRVLSDPLGLRIGGKRKELTVLCAEVSGFTEVVEGLEPEEVEEFLASFFACASEVVFKHEGTMDQFTGHGVRAFFGDPQSQDDHALRAVRCALEMRGRIVDAVRAWAHHGRPLLQAGMGIGTGYVTVGNVGSLHRMEYTVLGRSADLAAQLARAEPGRILVSPRTRAMTEAAVTYEARLGPDRRPRWFEAVSSR